MVRERAEASEYLVWVESEVQAFVHQLQSLLLPSVAMGVAEAGTLVWATALPSVTSSALVALVVATV